MKTIMVRNVVINLDKFIYAEKLTLSIRVYFEGLPAPHNFAVIHCDGKNDCQQVLEYINEQIKSKG